jgi:hypothetical protein
MSEPKNIPHPSDVDAYLLSNDWLSNDWPDTEARGDWAVYKREVNGQTYELEVPLRADARDYARVCMMMIADLEKAEGRKGSEIVSDMLDSKRQFARLSQAFEQRISKALGLTAQDLKSAPVTESVSPEKRSPGTRSRLNKRQRKNRLIGRRWGRGYCQPSAWVRHNIYHDDHMSDLAVCSHCLREPRTGQRRSADIKKRCRCTGIAGVQ